MVSRRPSARAHTFFRAARTVLVPRGARLWTTRTKARRRRVATAQRHTRADARDDVRRANRRHRRRPPYRPAARVLRARGRVAAVVRHARRPGRDQRVGLLLSRVARGLRRPIARGAVGRVHVRVIVVVLVSCFSEDAKWGTFHGSAPPPPQPPPSQCERRGVAVVVSSSSLCRRRVAARRPPNDDDGR